MGRGERLLQVGKALHAPQGQTNGHLAASGFGDLKQPLPPKAAQAAVHGPAIQAAAQLTQTSSGLAKRPTARKIRKMPDFVIPDDLGNNSWRLVRFTHASV